MRTPKRSPSRTTRIPNAPALGLLAVLALGMAPARPANATNEVRRISSGTAVVFLNADLLRELSIPIERVRSSAEVPAPLALMEDPHWAFAIRAESDLLFQVENHRAEPHRLFGGRIPLEGDILFRDERSGRAERLEAMEIATVPRGAGNPTSEEALVLRSGVSGEVFFRLVYSMFDYAPGDALLKIHYMNVEIAAEWANRLGNPDLAGRSTGIVEVIADTELARLLPDAPPDPVASFGDTVDVGLGNIFSLSYIARQGYLTGQLALSMATTACNLGSYDVPWLAPMLEDHPVIAMAIYRLLDGRFEQIGISDLKHGFYALSNDDCTPCRNHSNGSFLGVGCSDTYGVNNNADRTYLAPRHEVNPFTAEWDCHGSHFADGDTACVRHHGGSGHGPLDHRLATREAELDLPGAEYFYEAYYLVPRDHERWNNIGSRRFTASWNGTTWTFATPTVDNVLLTGPALDRWGDQRTVQPFGPDDGRLELAVQVTPLVGGGYHYEYALFNFDADSQAGQFAVPVPDSTEVTNLGFHDSDGDAANDWMVTRENGMLRWQAGAYPDSSANALGFGLLMNFRFDAADAPGPADAIVGAWKPHDPPDLLMATQAPLASAGITIATTAGARFDGVRPNPTTGGAELRFSLSTASETSLEVYAPTGRRVRRLLQGEVAGGEHAAHWDGKDEEGRPVAAGVYYCKLHAGRETRVQPVTIVR